MKTCPCGYAFHDGVTHCRKCGRKLGEDSRPATCSALKAAVQKRDASIQRRKNVIHQKPAKWLNRYMKHERTVARWVKRIKKLKQNVKLNRREI